MNPAAKRGIDLLAYTVSGQALAGAALYGVERLTSPAAAPAPPTAPVAASPAAVASAAAPPAESATPPDAGESTAPALPAPQSMVPPPVTAQPAITAQDRTTFFALQRNCYDAAANNQGGEYPALQASACNRYLQFANEHGWDTGTLPAYGQPQPKPRIQEAAQDHSTPAAAADPQVILVEPGYVHYHEVPQHQGSHPQPPPAPAHPASVTMPISRPAASSTPPH